MSAHKKETDRSLTVTWADPGTHAWDPKAVSGLAFLRGVQSGKIQPPPAARLVGYRISRVDPGRTIFELDPAEHHYNPFATVHGGILSVLLDTSMTSAVMSRLQEGHACSTLEMKTNFIRPVTAKTGTVQCEARTIHLGSRMATAEAKITDAEGTLYAHAVSTCIIFRPGSRDD
jgi:uncharacterized protein (TIGR00369 family)